MEAIFGAVAFGGMFLAWVVVPSFLRKRATTKSEEPSRE